MVLRFQVPWFLAPQPMPSLAGGQTRYRPVIPLTVDGPWVRQVIYVLVDSGADDIVLPLALASQIGVDLTPAVVRTAQGVGGGPPSTLWFAPLILELNDGRSMCRWHAVVAFTQAPMHYPMFGIAGGLEHFRMTLDIAAREVLLEPGPSLPAVSGAVP